MRKYNPKYHLIDPRTTLDIDFNEMSLRPELFGNPALKKELKAKYNLCSKLTNKLSQTVMTVEKATKPNKLRAASTIVSSPTRIINEEEFPANTGEDLMSPNILEEKNS